MIIDRVQIKSNILIKSNIYRVVFSAPFLASCSLPGQFVNIRCGAEDSYDPLFKRPFSIHSIDKNKGEVGILYAVVGRGTKLLSQMLPGQSFEINGPLGTGFDLSKRDTHHILVGGGLGIAPMLFAAQYLNEANLSFSVIMGAQTSDMICLENDFNSLSPSVSICTDDGSIGTKGLVTNAVRDIFDRGHSHRTILACGPWKMLDTVVSLCKEYNVAVQVSLEEHMACGLGVCLGCVVKTVKGMARVCHEGPVFNGKEVIWDE